MITQNGKTYQTVQDAANEFGVSAKTVLGWIKKGIIGKPPQFEYGVRVISFFPEDYMKRAKAALKEYREKNRDNKGQEERSGRTSQNKERI